MKIVRNVPKYTRDAKVEIQFMERVRNADPTDGSRFIKIQRYFQNDKGHMCIVMPKYGACLLDHMRHHGPLPPRQLAQVIFQMGTSLDYFHTELHLIHTDLKPENMLLETNDLIVDPVTNKSLPKEPCPIRICDLGGCCDERHSRHAIVSTRHYRSPEVILGLGWMYSTDMWSMGCILYELATGRLLYDTHENLEHLHMFEKTLGHLPSEWSRTCMEEAKPLFTSNGALRPVSDPKSIARIGRMRPLRELVGDELLRDLLLGLLTYDRSRRMTARAMSMHPFVMKHYPEAASHTQHPNNRTRLPPVPTM